MHTLRLRTRFTFSALFAAAMVAAMLAPLAPAPTVAAEESRVMATEQVYVRSGPSTSDAIIGELWEGDWVSTTGYYENGFAEVWYGDWVGYVYNDYLGLPSSEPAAAAPAPAEVPAEPAPPSPGQQMVNFAMQYLGYPYVWAGNTPGGFDCSGFTQYVVQNVLGYSISQSTDAQAGLGTFVAWGEWQPGDLIFFTGTGGGGYVSHVGIYIGDGQMIHAENPGTGVVISSLHSGYYSSHYYSAKRL